MKRKPGSTTPLPEAVSAREMAAILGETPQRLTELAAQGRIPAPKRGLYRLSATIQAYFAFVQRQPVICGSQIDPLVAGPEVASRFCRFAPKDCACAAQRRTLIPASVANQVHDLLVRVFNEEIETLPRLADQIASMDSASAITALFFLESRRIRKRMVNALLECARQIAPPSNT